jgi:uroporphyrinogen decarboxylase
MNNKQRLQSVFDGKIPDKVPTFELVFQIPEQAFGKSWPSQDQLNKATEKEREGLLDDFFTINEMIIEKFGWSAIQLPMSYGGYFDGQVIPRGKKRFGDKVMIYDFNGSGTFWMPTGNDMMDFIVKLFEQPDQIHREAKQKMADSIAFARKQVDQGVDFICINSDYGYNSGPFISPQMFSEFVTPYLTEIVDKFHSFGTKAILHSDGDLRTILDQIVSSGLDGYQSIDPQGNMDIAEVKKLYGDKLVLMGNVQTAYLQGADDTLIRDSVKYCMTHGKPNGRYIFSTSNCLFAGMPLKSYQIMLDEYEKYAKYGDGSNSLSKKK